MVQKRTKIIAGIGAAFFIACAAAYALFFFVVSNHKEQFVAQSVERAEAKSRHETLSALMRTLDDTQEARKELFTRILKEEDVIDLLALIESIGNEQGVTLKTNSLTVEPIDATFEALVVDLNVEGTYASVIHVLKLMEHLPYQASVTKVQLLREQPENGPFWKSTYEVRVTKFKKT
jgi:hypothetical protein